jgi:hypothetical protein
MKDTENIFWDLEDVGDYRSGLIYKSSIFHY